MPYPGYTVEEVARRGDEIYDRQIRPLVEAGNKGKFVVIDIESGAYEVDDDDLTASKRLLARHPNAVMWGQRIGYDAAYRLGSSNEG